MSKTCKAPKHKIKQHVPCSNFFNVIVALLQGESIHMQLETPCGNCMCNFTLLGTDLWKAIPPGPISNQSNILYCRLLYVSILQCIVCYCRLHGAILFTNAHFWRLKYGQLPPLGHRNKSTILQYSLLYAFTTVYFMLLQTPCGNFMCKFTLLE